MADMTMDDTDRINRLYQAIATKAAEREPTFREKSIEDRRAYLREAARKYRAKGKKAAESGRLEARSETIREVLADAALILLASGASGADAVEKLLGIAFAGRPGIPSTVRAKARAGAIKPRILTPDVLRTHALSQTALSILDRAPDVPPELGDDLKSDS